MDTKQFTAIMNKLEMIHQLLALNLTRELEFKDKVLLLNHVGFSESDIVKLLNSNRAKVHSVLWRSK